MAPSKGFISSCYFNEVHQKKALVIRYSVQIIKELLYKGRGPPNMSFVWRL